ncbi:TetR/AcrR family transcriptional regulator [Glycomyces paridis]|uniref:TetR/AcrR family transcriptional regulator n=1 Tax=Glycomyces paridis TaxID=2126555 RepID=A0A4S8P8H9_9ACTN|nr:TetR/AcrR family transcriptional regulator [Glycomyces paridis]THV26523.1 TetR/AcrR family transcriptional regulator [Glycomyces paridis]
MTARSAATRETIVRAAAPVFGRYGYRKTTMDLLASAAGVSRPAVYQYFPNKAAVLRAVADLIGDEVHTAAETAADAATGTAERLYAALVAKLEFTAATVEADHRRELLSEASRIAADAVAASEARYTALVSRILAEAPDLDLLGDAATAEDTAELLTDSMTGIARSTATADQMRARLRLLVDLAVRGLSTSDNERSTP